jgi:hypothetical protein
MVALTDTVVDIACQKAVFAAVIDGMDRTQSEVNFPSVRTRRVRCGQSRQAAGSPSTSTRSCRTCPSEVTHPRLRRGPFEAREGATRQVQDRHH